MSLYTIIFYFFEAVAALSALALLFTKNVFYGALLLITCLLAVAGLYVLSFAEFVGIAQIRVYAGGVLVVIIFGIMLTARIGEKPLRVDHTNVFGGSLIASILFGILCYLLTTPTTAQKEASTGFNSLESIGMNLLTNHLIPFEVSGILLLVALIGAAVIASHKSKEA
jgi:NADH:ubiquinone oxidoreductase subunit 6 (subunit J)